jgi:hypothetical protein
MFVGKVSSLPQSGEPERRFSWVGSGLTVKHETRLEKLARENHSGLLQKFVNYWQENVLLYGHWVPML